jgi:hypothetical protein
MYVNPFLLFDLFGCIFGLRLWINPKAPLQINNAGLLLSNPSALFYDYNFCELIHYGRLLSI